MLAVAFGAFGAHALRAALDPGAMAVYQTAVQYQFYHALALLAVGVLAGQGTPRPWLRASGWAFSIGIGLFCGSLYALALTGVRAWGMVTPIGGLAFLAGWGLLAATPWIRS